MVYGYVRNASERQNIDFQVNALKKVGCNKIITEMASFKSEKVKLQKLIKAIKPRDTILVWRIDSLGYSTKSLLNFLLEIEKKEVILKSITDDLDTSSQFCGKTIANFAKILIEMEAHLIHEKRMIGRELSLSSGIKFGRPNVIDKETFLAAFKMYKNRKMSVREICDRFKINVRSFYRYLEKQE
jgi:DNA invertase Pin-like site-specific DNA recombinase